MGLISWFRKNAKAETRDAETGTRDAETGTIPVAEPLISALMGESRLTPDMAMEIPAFSASVDFIAQTVAELPVELYREIPGKKAEKIAEDPRLFPLNDEAEPLMNAVEAKKALVSDMLIYGSGYMYISRQSGTLHYVRHGAVSVQTNSDPIFKDADIRVNGARYYPWEFVILSRHSRNGVSGTGIAEEHKTLLLAAYNMLKFENVLSRTGGSKKGFLQSEYKLSKEEIAELRRRWKELYENNDNMMMVLNNGVKYAASASTPMEMQLSQNKIANSKQITQIFGLSPEVISGAANTESFVSSIRTAVLPVVTAFQAALNRSLLTEAEKRGKEPLYFALDTSALLRADTLSRYQAYALALQNNFLQIDEVRYMEDREPIGFNYVKLGLQDVLLDPKTGRIYTPNTNKTADMNGNALTSDVNGDIIEERERHYTRGDHGYFTGSTSDGSSGGSGRGGSSGKIDLTKRGGSGIIKASGGNSMLNVDIDELVPCLKDAETGEILKTEAAEMTRASLRQYTAKTGWNDDWAKRPSDEKIFGVFIKGETTPQGIISIRNEKGGVYLASASAAPWNNKQMNGGKKKYDGVGGHLFAIAAEQSVRNGWGGTIYGYAVNKEVLQHYINHFGAVHIPIVHEFQFVIDPLPAQKLIETYNYERR